jgi:hypothetical protein
MKGQDILVMLKVLCAKPEDRWSYAGLSKELSMSASEVHASIKRCTSAGLFNSETRQPIRAALEEFLIHGIRYVFPVTLGPIVTGLPTAYAGPALNGKILFNETPVMPLMRGPARGPEVAPLYPSAPKAAQVDARLYHLLTIVDALRMGRSRERKLAGTALSELLAQR